MTSTNQKEREREREGITIAQSITSTPLTNKIAQFCMIELPVSRHSSDEKGSLLKKIKV